MSKYLSSLHRPTLIHNVTFEDNLMTLFDPQDNICCVWDGWVRGGSIQGWGAFQQTWSQLWRIYLTSKKTLYWLSKENLQIFLFLGRIYIDHQTGSQPAQHIAKSPIIRSWLNVKLLQFSSYSILHLWVESSRTRWHL